jgi:hypothetical protein
MPEAVRFSLCRESRWGGNLQLPIWPNANLPSRSAPINDDAHLASVAHRAGAAPIGRAKMFVVEAWPRIAAELAEGDDNPLTVWQDQEGRCGVPACQLPTGSSPCTSLSANSSIMLRSYSSIVSILSSWIPAMRSRRRVRVSGAGISRIRLASAVTERNSPLLRGAVREYLAAASAGITRLCDHTYLIRPLAMNCDPPTIACSECATTGAVAPDRNRRLPVGQPV